MNYGPSPKESSFCICLRNKIAYAYYVTEDPWFRDLWRSVVCFCLKSQIRSENRLIDGSWCRAFDMDRGEAYGCPHDAGWAAYASETGWTVGEILMGMMLPDILSKKTSTEK